MSLWTDTNYAPTPFLKKDFTMNINPDYALKNDTCRNPRTYNQVIHFFQKTFSGSGDELKEVANLARKIQEGIKRMNPFIQQANQSVCPQCKDVCCISKHGYYTCEDLMYLTALGLEPPHTIFGMNDTDPCQYRLEHGCSLERSRRPSGCTWYFCESLLDYMEPQPLYREFDESLRDVAELWLAMAEEFRKIPTAKSSRPIHSEHCSNDCHSTT